MVMCIIRRIDINDRKYKKSLFGSHVHKPAVPRKIYCQDGLDVSSMATNPTQERVINRATGIEIAWRPEVFSNLQWARVNFEGGPTGARGNGDRHDLN